ncbi:hypothetical protein [Methylophaga lonarensis]|uniref:hypothetical protein n=1 Tax=Methylophaga lonarensis TaxID=999151 RepID=UPI003D27A909
MSHPQGLSVAKVVSSALLGVFLLGQLVTKPALASPQTDALGQCLVANTSTAERELMIQWMFLGMAQHQSLAGLLSDSVNKEETDIMMGYLVQNVLTERCSEQMAALMQREGLSRFDESFELWGSVAMREMLTDPAVEAALLNFTKFIDFNEFTR